MPVNNRIVAYVLPRPHQYTPGTLRYSHRMMLLRSFAPILISLSLFAQPRPGRDPAQTVDEEYTRKIKEYTTEPFFNSPLTDYLPASKTVPTPKAVLGDIAGAPNI